jgi:ectoine hydroxylase-related dioxygenase (phytanoyl-CoA dioxygenase family)
MTKALTSFQRGAYEKNGVVLPISVLSEGEVCEAMRQFESLKQRDGGKLSNRSNEKCHLLLPGLARLVRHARILDAVESILGPNILCWGSGFSAKDAGDGTYFSWHQDSTYWGLSSTDVVTAWVALTSSTSESGCVKVIPASHTEQLPHRDTYAERNLLSRGQEISVEVDETKAVHLCLQPGEMSLHHIRLIHGSDPNRSGHSRIGFAIRYIPTRVYQTDGKTTAMLVRGVDDYRNFEAEPVPESDYADEAVRFHAYSVDMLSHRVFDGATTATFR